MNRSAASAAVARAFAAAALALACSAATPAPAGPPRDADGFRLAVPPRTFTFPADHAAHPSYRTEWWYYTGHLASGTRRFGYELTFFRVGLPRLREASRSAWATRDLVFVHLALTDESRGTFRFHDDVRRAVLGQAWADSTRYDVGLEESFARLAADGTTHQLRGVAPEFSFALALRSGTPPVVHGHDGVSQKTAGAGNASHYYSLPRLSTRGTLVVGGDSLAVTGESWMDHEFGSAGMSASHAGWDWFSVQLADGRSLMLYTLRLKSGGIEPLSSGTWIEADGRSRPLSLADFRVRATGAWTSPRSGARYPSGWHVSLPREKIELDLAPLARDQELTAASMGGVVYWEGSVRVRGSQGDRALAGQGYVELTGYAGRTPF